tara:strand:- start:4461 stop:7325 length:2865 start_codon:yes stop_codon:yes gene_type:complete
MALTKITTSVIAANTLATSNIADNSIDATKIASNSILTRHIDDDQVTGDQLADTISIVTDLNVGNDLAVTGNTTITGNLTVNGSTVTNSASNTTIEDALIELGTGTSGSPSTDAGIVIERGSSDNVFIGWDESADKVTVGTGSFTGASSGNLSITPAAFVSGALTASGLAYPTSDGSANQVIQTDGSGNLSFGNKQSSSQVDTYATSGDGSTTAFDTGTNPLDEKNTWVFIDGVYQQKSTYSYSGSTITFGTAPDNGAAIDVITGTTDSMSSSDTVLGVYEATTTATATYSTGLSASNENNTWVFVGGVLQPKDSYTFSGGTLTFDAATPAGEKLSVTATRALTAGSVVTASMGANAVTSAKIASNSILSRHIANNSIVGADISATTGITAATFTGALTGNVTGNVTGNITGNVLTAAQTNITSLGTLSALTVSGQLTAGGLSYPTSDGSADQVLKTDGSGALSFGTVSGTTINSNADNRVITGSGTANTLNGESTLTFDGNNCLKIIAAGNTTNGGNIQLGITTDDTAKYTAITANQHDSGTETEGFLLIGGNSAANDSNLVNIGGGFGEANPATQIQFYTGSAATREGTNRMVIDPSGDIGIGTASPNTQMHIYKASTNAHHDHIKLEMASGWAGSQNKYKSIVWNDGSSNVGGIGMTYDGTTTNMHFHSMYSGGYKSETTNILSLLGSGKVGINASAPTQALEVADSSNYKGIHIRGSVAPCLTFAQSSSTTPTWRAGISGYDGSAFAIATGASVGDKLHIKSNGTVLIGKTATNQTTTTGHEFQTSGTVYRAEFNVSNNEFMILNNHSSPSGTASMSFRYNNAQKGSIGLTSSAVSYNSNSDYRLKENVDYSWDATTRLKQLKPCRFNWISDETNTLEDGFLAHEVSSVVPNAVEGTKDEVYDSEHELAGEAKYQQVDNSKLVPLLVKTIQEQQTIIDDLKSRVETLENN